ncbi:MAG TPA: hypothetical protein VK673_03035 [Chthoniobacterales bacterium]|nr:hypothetical protein [Chthoniobacterales bacterium]
MPATLRRSERKPTVTANGHEEKTANALRALGTSVRFTVLPGRDHGILDTYENEELYWWFLEHARSDKNE